MVRAENTEVARKLQIPASKTKAAHIDGEQFRYGLRQIEMAPDRFAAYPFYEKPADLAHALRVLLERAGQALR